MTQLMIIIITVTQEIINNAIGEAMKITGLKRIHVAIIADSRFKSQ